MTGHASARSQGLNRLCRRFHKLLVLDADTGRPLHTLKLPSMKAPDASDDDMELDILDIADGALSIGWRGGGGGLLIAFD
ncbi:hypothetical protein ACFWJM_01125 [Streptomyces sp. NPDC127077]|uniref:hypothetical protein n=1 Tax=Streptomyces sp. NPDC127077 TaxID=3347131 RepID=UPI0036498D01